MWWKVAVEVVLLISLTLCYSSEARNVKSLYSSSSSVVGKQDDFSRSSHFVSGGTSSISSSKVDMARPQFLFPPIIPPVLPSPTPTIGGVPLPPNPFQPPPLLPNPLQPPSPPAFGLPLIPGIPGLTPSPPPPAPVLPLPPGLPIPPVVPGIPGLPPAIPGLPVPLPPLIPGVPPAR